MSLSIKNPETDRLVRRLAALTGEGLTEAVLVERGDGFAVTANPGMIASACRAVELGAAHPADGNQELAAYGYKRGLCGPDSYAAALYGGYPAQR